MSLNQTLAFHLIILAGCSSKSSEPASCDLAEPSCTISQTVGSEGGTIAVSDGGFAGFLLDIPPGALVEDTVLSVQVRPGTDLQAEPWTFSTQAIEGDTMLYMDTWQTLYEVLEDWGKYEHFQMLFILENLRQEGLGTSNYTFHFEPSGLIFNKPARLTLPYVEGESKGAQTLWPALRIAQWSSVEQSARLLQNSVVDPVAHTIAGDMEHFSDYQVKNGIADALSRLGGWLPNPTSVLVKTAALTLINNSSATTEPLVIADVEFHAKNIADEILCALARSGLQADFSIPSDASWNELMAVLSTMPSLFGADHPDANNFTTGHEAELASQIMSQSEKVSFAEEFALSVELNNGEVFNALMTMHNLGQSYNLTPYFKDMSHIHPDISDLRGAHYHMAGLSLLALFNNNDAQSFMFGLGDEAIMSGLLQDSFEPGELVANLIGSQLMTEVAKWDPTAVCVDGLRFKADDDNPYLKRFNQVYRFDHELTASSNLIANHNQIRVEVNGVEYLPAVLEADRRRLIWRESVSNDDLTIWFDDNTAYLDTEVDENASLISTSLKLYDNDVLVDDISLIMTRNVDIVSPIPTAVTFTKCKYICDIAEDARSQSIFSVTP